MARKSIGYTELVWTCPNCQNKNPGLQKVCGSCGSPQPKEVQFVATEKQDQIKDQKIIDQIKSGPDIYCPYCGTRNPGNSTLCTQCSGDLKGGIRRNAGEVVGTYKPVQSAKVLCPNCGSSNDETHQYCMKCGGNLSGKPQPTDQVAKPVVKAPFSPWMIVAGLVGIALCLILAILLISGPGNHSSITGTVASVSWVRNVDILAISPVFRQDWQQSIPNDAEIQYCEERYHHTQDQPTTGAIEVCGTPYIIDTGTGAGEIVQDCLYEVYQEYCQYSILDWVVVDTLSVSGNDTYPYWPDYRLASDQRLGNQTERYQVTFQTEKGLFTYTTTSAAQFQQLAPGSRWELEIDGFNNLVGISPIN